MYYRNTYRCDALLTPIQNAEEAAGTLPFPFPRDASLSDHPRTSNLE